MHLRSNREWILLKLMAFILCVRPTFLLSQASPSQAPAATAGVTFVEGSSSKLILERDGKKYLVDLSTKTITEIKDGDASVGNAAQHAPAANPTAPGRKTSPGPPDSNADIYKAGDDLVFSVPTGRRPAKRGMYINFTHRFPYEAAFSGPARGATLLGLDDFAIPAFGVRYGVTDKFSVFAYRAPSIIARPIELMAAYNFLDEKDGQPFNASVRFSVDGQDNFSRNFTENFELLASRSIGKRAQLYIAPTFNIHNRPVLGASSALTNPPPYQPCNAAFAAGTNAAQRIRPCANTFSLGAALAVDIRPTVALVAEAIPTLVNGPDLGIHRPAYSFGIQKHIWRHAFTFGFTNSPGTTVSQRAGTRATFLGDPGADKPKGMFIGFDLTRQVF
ncbi:MAG TPA: DUF5777 family beta-barrel protein [Candidatus Sulfotelmatobacter sp.]|nr:DUF5777 family beta-barrel protein [Candidatus Sulfotelmatobacter sp.]